MLHKKLQSDMQAAMKAKDAERLQTLRMTLAACTNALIAQKKKPTETLEDTEVLTVIKRSIKQRQEAAMHYTEANQTDRATAEKREQKILEDYMPPEMEEEAIQEIVLRAQKELQLFEKKDQGRLMKEVMSKVQGQADGKTVMKLVSGVLQ